MSTQELVSPSRVAEVDSRARIRSAIRQLLNEPALGQSVAGRLRCKTPGKPNPRTEVETALAVLYSCRRRHV